MLSPKAVSNAAQAPATKILSWEDAKSREVPRDQMVWIQYWDGKPCETTASPPIEDVAAFIEQIVAQRGDVWVVVRPWDLSSETIDGYRELLKTCESSRAKGVILTEERSRMEGAFPFRPPFRPGPNLSRLIRELEKKRAEKAQPSATDNPDGAQSD